MNVEAKRNELIQWILNLSEDTLRKVDAIKQKATLDDVVAYSVDGNPLTEKQYIGHINDIRESVRSGAKTYTTEEVKKIVLNSRRA